MSAVNPDLNYPRMSPNIGRKRANFWSEMGLDVGSHQDVKQVSSTLYRAPVARYEDDGFLVNKPGSGQEAEGRISLRAAERILGSMISEGEEIVVRMLESGRSPEHADTYDATLEVEGLSEGERAAIPENMADPLMLERIPDGFEYGKNYDFTVLNAGTDDYLIMQ